MNNTKKEKVSYSEVARELLRKPLLPGDELKEELRERGMEPGETAALLLAMLKSAKGGNVSAAKFLCGAAGWLEKSAEEPLPPATVLLRAEELEGLSDRQLVQVIERSRKRK